MARRSIIPFFIGSKRILSLKELKEALLANPASLLEPFKDGRLERFLRGISNTYIECLKAETPEEAIKGLARELGIELNDSDFSFEKSNSSISSEEEFFKKIEQGEEIIELPTGEFFIEKLTLERPIKFVGQGKNSTVLKCKTLEVYSEGVVFENLDCEVDEYFPKKKPEFIDSLFKFENSVSRNLGFIIGIDTKKKVEISEQIILRNTEVHYENAILIFNEGGSITFENCKCFLTNCSFKGTEKVEKSSLVLKSSEANIKKCHFTENATLEISEKSTVQLSECVFSNNSIGITQSSSSEVNIENCEFIENQHGIQVYDEAKLKVLNSKFLKHQNPVGTGTGIIGFNSSQIEVENCELVENQHGIGIQGEVNLKVLNSKFLKHQNPDGTGSGIIGVNSSQIEVENCEFTENQRGIGVKDEAKLKVLNSKFLNHQNPVSTGTGIIGVNSSQIEVENCELVENERGIDVRYRVILEVLDCSIDVLLSGSPNVHIFGSNIKIIKYKSDSEKPAVERSSVGSWTKAGFLYRFLGW